MDGWMDEWVSGWMDRGWVDGWESWGRSFTSICPVIYHVGWQHSRLPCPNLLVFLLIPVGLSSHTDSAWLGWLWALASGRVSSPLVGVMGPVCGAGHQKWGLWWGKKQEHQSGPMSVSLWTLTLQLSEQCCQQNFLPWWSFLCLCCPVW